MARQTNRRRYESLFAALPPEEKERHLNLILQIIAALIRGEDWRAVLPPSPRPRSRRPTSPRHRH